MLLAELFLREPRDVRGRERVVDLPSAHGGRGDGEMTIDERFLERVDARRVLDDVDRADRPPADTLSVRSVLPPTIQRSVKPKFFIARAAAPTLPGLQRLDEDDAYLHGRRDPYVTLLIQSKLRRPACVISGSSSPSFFLLLASSAFAQTTGGLIGRVTDSSGAALPGVTVEVRSPRCRAYAPT